MKSKEHIDYFDFLNVLKALNSTVTKDKPTLQRPLSIYVHVQKKARFNESAQAVMDRTRKGKMGWPRDCRRTEDRRLADGGHDEDWRRDEERRREN